MVVGSGIVQAATTISTNITTAGNISTTGTGTLTAAGLSTLTGGFISIASSTAVAAFNVTGSSTLASTTVTSLKMGQVGTKVSQVVSGYCVATTLTDLVATTTGVYADCVPYTSGGVAITTLTSGTDKVLVQATSSLPGYVVLQAASTTGTAKINVRLTNVSTTTTGAAAGAIYTFNFWAFQSSTL